MIKSVNDIKNAQDILKYSQQSIYLYIKHAHNINKS